jgi:hypothetical protein
MWRWLCLTWTAAAAVIAAGCSTGPLQDNPLLVRSEAPLITENPVYIPLGSRPQDYALVFEKVLDVIDDYFEIAYANRYDGRIETFPQTAPGLGQPWKPGSPDLYQRTYALFQSVRHRALVRITVANDGGFFVDLKVLKELEDLPAPSRATPGSASFRNLQTIERQYEVVEAGQYEANWIPIGRDLKLEQVLLSRIAAFDIAAMRKQAETYVPPKECPPWGPTTAAPQP